MLNAAATTLHNEKTWLSSLAVAQPPVVWLTLGLNSPLHFCLSSVRNHSLFAPWRKRLWWISDVCRCDPPASLARGYCDWMEFAIGCEQTCAFVSGLNVYGYFACSGTVFFFFEKGTKATCQGIGGKIKQTNNLLLLQPCDDSLFAFIISSSLVQMQHFMCE